MSKITDQACVGPSIDELHRAEEIMFEHDTARIARRFFEGNCNAPPFDFAGEFFVRDHA